MNQTKVEETSIVLIIIADPEGVELNRERILVEPSGATDSGSLFGALGTGRIPREIAS
jgi:hypothetical protein